MQPAQPFAVGARVFVLWTDGGSYPATICAHAQGYAQVRWDAGGAPAWVPFSNLGPSPNAPPQQSPSHAAPAGPHLWSAHGWSGPPAGAADAAAKPQATSASAPAAGASGLPKSVAQPAPRPMKSELHGLPRGLVYDAAGRGPGTGKAFFFFFGFVASNDTDMSMRMTDIEHLGDDVAALRAAGFHVVVDLHGDLKGLNAALSQQHPDAENLETAGVYWASHGDDDGSLQDFEGFRIRPDAIAAEATQRAAVKLFVMSACWVGAAEPAWKKALGSQAIIIGWGAPLSNARAVDFLTPDNDSSKELDDLLLRHLGVARVSEDGLLVDARQLALKHEEKTATMLLSFDELVDAVNARLKNLAKRDANSAIFLVIAPPSKDHPGKLRTQLVRVSPTGLSAPFITVSSLVGPYSDALDIPRALRMLDVLTSTRLTISKLGQPSTEFVLLESVHRRRRLDPLSLARSIMSVGMFADRIEDVFFGSDER